MSSTGPRRLRADAARNAERLVCAAREAFAESGINVSLEGIAKRANVGVATLYRRFPNKVELLQAVLEASYAEQVEPVIGRALADEDPWHGMVTVFEAVLTMAAEESVILAAATTPGALPPSLTSRFFTALGAITTRAQEAGLVRADLRPEDLPMLMMMLVSTVQRGEWPAEAWRRYLVLVLDALRPAAASPLPPLSSSAEWRPGPVAGSR